MPPYRSGRIYNPRPQPIVSRNLMRELRGEKPRKKLRSQMSELEKVMDDIQKDARKAQREAKKIWEANLPQPWSGPADFRWDVGTLGMYKSDAKSGYRLTEREILTLPYESIMGSSKTFFSHARVRALSRAKERAGVKAPLSGIEAALHEVRVFRRMNTTNRMARSNWNDLGFMLIADYDDARDPEAKKIASEEVESDEDEDEDSEEDEGDE